MSYRDISSKISICASPKLSISISNPSNVKHLFDNMKNDLSLSKANDMLLQTTVGMGQNNNDSLSTTSNHDYYKQERESPINAIPKQMQLN